MEQASTQQVTGDGSTGASAYKEKSEIRLWVASAFTRVEDIAYVGLGLLLAGSAASLLITTLILLVKHIVSGAPFEGIVDLLDRSLIILMILELLYTVQVSFREHALVPEPFLVVGLIAVTRRILVLTAQLSTVIERGTQAQFQNALTELGLLTVMVVALVLSLLMLRRWGKASGPNR
jgi:uncharacterized membrane protein (DUF373 family)